MKNFCLVLVFSVISFTIQAQSDNRIVIGKIDSVQSKILDEKRKIWVHVPESGPGNVFTKQRYPVVYLLDGDAHFPSVVGMIQQLSTVNGNTICPEMIVVGIPNTDRTRDLTPTHITSDPPMMDTTSSKTTGGGGKFISFLEKELMPHIDSLYPTAPYKLLIGHSFGGLLVMQALTGRPGLFNAYVAIDPSMWYNKEKFLTQTKKALTDKKYAGVSLFVGIANTMDEGMTPVSVEKDTTADTRHIRSILDLDRYIKANKPNGLRYQSKYYGDDSHGSVPLIAEYDALRFIFDYYNLKLIGKDFMDDSPGLANKYATHFATVSTKMGYKTSPSEMLINSLGYYMISQKHFKKAESLFKLNVANYPQSYNVYDSYGDLFIAKKDTVNALANFNKALSLKENPETRRKVEALQKQETLKLTPAELNKYAGDFDMAGKSVKTYVKNNVLRLQVAGQPEYELVPTKPNEFTVKGLTGYKGQFEMNGGKPITFISVQPNGTFRATLKK